MTSWNPPRIAIATNNGDIGGGEVMLLNIAEALRDLGVEPLVVGPAEPSGLVDEAQRRDFEIERVPATSRPTYMAALATWRLRNLRIPLWCNGLVPSVATSGLGPRIVHLHVVPTASQRRLVPAARFGAVRTLVPSAYLASEFPGATVLANWTVDLTPVVPPPSTGGPLRVGFMGRHSPDKGLDVLLRSMAEISEHRGREVRFVLAGDSRFVSADDRRAVDEAVEHVENRIERAGWISRGEFFSGIDLAVFPSVARETFGLVAAEAMASGVPFVVSDDGALAEVVGPTHPFVSDRGDAKDLAQVIRRALDAVVDCTASGHIEAARRRWEELYSPAAGLRRVADLLMSIERRKA